MRTAGHESRSPVVALLSLAMAAAGLVGGCGGPVVPSLLPPPPSRTGLPPTPVPTVASPTPTDDPGAGIGEEYQLPTPKCPPPPGAIAVPDVLVSRAGSSDPGVIGVRGSSTFATCTTTSTTDTAGPPVLPALTVTPQDKLILRIQDGWSILRVEGFDAPAIGDGGNIQAPIDTPDGTDRVEVVVPERDGEARVAWTVYVIRADGRAVGMVSVSVLLHLVLAGG